MLKVLNPKTDPLKQELVDFVNAANKITSYAYGIYNTKLPVLTQSIENYGEVAQKVASLKIDALSWINEALQSFQLLPAAFESMSPLLDIVFKKLEDDMVKLKSDPKNPKLRKSISSSMSIIRATAQNAHVSISDLEINMESFASKLSPDLKSLNDLISSIAKAESADQAQVKKLQKAIANLQSIIDDRQEIMTLNKWLDWTEKIFVAIIGVAVGGVIFENPIVSVIIGVAAATITTWVPLHGNIQYEQSLQDLKDGISNISDEIGAINTVVAQLQSLSSRFQDLTKQGNAIQSALVTVKNFWKNIDVKLEKIIVELDNETSRMFSPKAIDRAITELKKTDETWTDLISFVSKLKNLDYNFDNNIIMVKGNSKKPKVKAKVA